jgi:hypothetical protein
MGDSGEGLIDSESKIQERRDELQANRDLSRKPARKNPEQLRQLDSLNLARTQMSRQLEIVTHEGRRRQIVEAIADIDIRIAGLHAAASAAS